MKLFTAAAARRLLLAALLSLLGLAPARGAVYLQFSTTNYYASETARVATITVLRVGGAVGLASVDYQTGDHGVDVEEGKDFYPTNGTLVFSNGVTSRTFQVPVLDDFVHDTNKQIVLELVNPTNALLGARMSARLNLVDSDPCVRRLTPPSLALGPEGTIAQVVVAGPTGCPWTAVVPTNYPWIGILEGSGDGGETVTLSVDENQTKLTRVGRVLIGRTELVLTQRPFPPPDSNGPIIAITFPAPNARVTNADLIVRGTARDNVEVNRVEYSVEHNREGASEWAVALNTTNWQAALTPYAPGTNTVRIQAWDRTNNPSVILARTFFYATPSLLTVTTNGNGRVTLPLAGRMLDVNRGYLLTATPLTNHLFSHWSGDLTGTVARLNFTMQSNLNVTANFVTNPFLAVKGNYTGLFRESGGVRHESSGLLNIMVMGSGAFSGSGFVGGRSNRFTGAFNLEGVANAILTGSGTNQLTLRLALDLQAGADKLTGELSDGAWTATLDADRTVPRSTSNYTGRYTAVIFGRNEPHNYPGGEGFGTVVVGANGMATFTGTLADGTPVGQTRPVSKDGHWPCYVPLYRGNGSFFCQVFLSPGGLNYDFGGDYTWSKPPVATNRFYEGGFAISDALIGSRYATPGATNRVLPFTGGLMTFSGGNLGAPFVNQVLLRPNNSVTNAPASTNKLTFTLNKTNGLFSGTVAEPNSTRVLSFKGAVLTKAGTGHGFFLGTNQSGRVLFETAP